VSLACLGCLDANEKQRKIVIAREISVLREAESYSREYPDIVNLTIKEGCVFPSESSLIFTDVTLSDRQ